MKRILLVAVGLVFTGSLAFGQVTQVVSRNAVGYVKVCIPASNKFFLATCPFNDVGDTTPRTITEIFGDQLTGADGLIFGSDFLAHFNRNSQTYDVYWKLNPGNGFGSGPAEWRRTDDAFTPSTNTFVPGESFFVQNNQISNQCLFVMGEVPDRFTSPTGNVPVVSGFTHAAYPFPTDLAISNSTLTSVFSTGFFGDKLIRFEPNSQTYFIYFIDDGTFGGGWQRTDALGVQTADRINAGEGAFVQRLGGGFTWSEPKPYTWP